MMTFYAAAGSYRFRNSSGRRLPFIQKLGKLHAVSVPEFLIWSIRNRAALRPQRPSAGNRSSAVTACLCGS